MRNHALRTFVINPLVHIRQKEKMAAKITTALNVLFNESHQLMLKSIIYFERDFKNKEPLQKGAAWVIHITM